MNTLSFCFKHLQHVNMFNCYFHARLKILGIVYETSDLVQAVV